MAQMPIDLETKVLQNHVTALSCLVGDAANTLGRACFSHRASSGLRTGESNFPYQLASNPSNLHE